MEKDKKRVVQIGEELYSRIYQAGYNHQLDEKIEKERLADLDYKNDCAERAEELSKAYQNHYQISAIHMRIDSAIQGIVAAALIALLFIL